MTPETIATGRLLVAAFLITCGVGIIWLVRSEWAERRANRQAIDAAETAAVLEALARLKADIDSEEADWAAWFAECPRDPAPLASVTPLPQKARVIRMPQQRGASE